MDLNTFGTSVVTQLSRIANSMETLEKAANGGTLAAHSPAEKPNTNSAPAGETAAAKKKRLAAEAEAAAAAKGNDSPKIERNEVNAVLIQIKDTIGKAEAQAVYQKYDYTAMSKIEEKDFAAILADAKAVLEKAANTNVEDANEEDDL